MSDLSVESVLERAREAQSQVDAYDQAAVDELMTAVAWATYQEDHATEIAAAAVENTRIGNVADKRQKLRHQVHGCLADLQDEASVGVVDRDRASGTIEVAKPVGVIGALIPSTNPGATVAHLSMLASKTRNAVVFVPAPGGEAACDVALEYVRAELERIDAPPDLVQTIPGRSTKSKARTVVHEADLVQVTGSTANVELGQTSGTPNVCVGAGNVVSLVDRTADVQSAAEDLAWSAGFDFGATCVNANSIVVAEAVADEFRDRLVAAGGYRCTDTQREKLEDALFPDGSLNRQLVAKDTSTIRERASLADPAIDEASFLLVEPDGIGESYPLSGEKLAPVVALYRAPDFETALTDAQAILDYEGSGHSCTLHTSSDAHVERVGQAVDVGRVVVNQPTLDLAGGFENGLDFALSLGGGTWAGNQFDENLDYTHFMNTTTVARPADLDYPDSDDLFDAYLTER